MFSNLSKKRVKLRNAHAVLFHPSEEGSAEVVKRWKVDENNVPSWGEIVFFPTLRFSLLISLWIWWDLHVLRIFWAFSFFYAFFFEHLSPSTFEEVALGVKTHRVLANFHKKDSEKKALLLFVLIVFSPWEKDEKALNFEERQVFQQNLEIPRKTCKTSECSQLWKNLQNKC